MRAGQLVEVNGVKEIFARPVHPYTRLLLESLPTVRARRRLPCRRRAQRRPGGGCRIGRTMTPLLELRNVGKVFGGGGFFTQRQTIALQDFSLAIDGEQPTIVAVVGESGSGKSTMANLLLGLETPTSGEVRYKGSDLRQLSREERRTFRRDVQAIFQDPFGVYNSFYKVDHVLTTPIAKFKLAKSKAETRRADRAGADARSVSAPTRRSAATRTNSAAGSASGRWSRAPCCCGRR